MKRKTPLDQKWMVGKEKEMKKRGKDAQNKQKKSSEDEEEKPALET